MFLHLKDNTKKKHNLLFVKACDSSENFSNSDHIHILIECVKEAWPAVGVSVSVPQFAVWENLTPIWPKE